MGPDSKVEGVMVNKYSKFGLNPFDSMEVIDVWKNFNLWCNADANANSNADARVTV